MGSNYELEREERIAANRARMIELGLVEASNVFAAEVRGRARASASRKRRSVKDTVLTDAPMLPARRSGRNEGKAAPVYSDDVLHAVDGGQRSRGRGGGAIYIPAGPLEEVYTLEHVAMLGDCQTPWELFVDGYDVGGVRLYDKAHGLTCHQCRQKTVGKRTVCSCCQSLTGVFCGDCLFMRYGENVDEALAKPGWRCPYCRDPRLCNCSIHRTRYGWAPTGSLFRKAVALGFKSAAHYLVLNNLAPPLGDAAAQSSAEAPLDEVGEAPVKGAAGATEAAESGVGAEAPASPEVAEPTQPGKRKQCRMAQPRIDCHMAASKAGGSADKANGIPAKRGAQAAHTATAAVLVGGKREATAEAAMILSTRQSSRRRAKV